MAPCWLGQPSATLRTAGARICGPFVGLVAGHVAVGCAVPAEVAAQEEVVVDGPIAVRRPTGIVTPSATTSLLTFRPARRTIRRRDRHPLDPPCSGALLGYTTAGVWSSVERRLDGSA